MRVSEGLTHCGDGGIWDEEHAVAGDYFEDADSCDDCEAHEKFMAAELVVDKGKVLLGLC